MMSRTGNADVKSVLLTRYWISNAFYCRFLEMAEIIVTDYRWILFFLRWTTKYKLKCSSAIFRTDSIFSWHFSLAKTFSLKLSFDWRWANHLMERFNLNETNKVDWHTKQMDHRHVRNHFHRNFCAMNLCKYND